MSFPPPRTLPENAGLAFIGETRWSPAQLSARHAESFAAGHNPNGRPNTDVLRRFVGYQSGTIRERTQIDFPPHFTEQEAALYGEPFKQLGASTRKYPGNSWWQNPHAQPALRTAVTRLERYLATPLDKKEPQWSWIDSQRLPDASLLIVARDDDFLHGLLRSRFFNLWWRLFSLRLAAPEIVATFPFPWPPVTLLSSLTRDQEERRLAVARAVRSGAQDQLDSAVAATYGWSIDIGDEALLAFIEELNRKRG